MDSSLDKERKVSTLANLLANGIGRVWALAANAVLFPLYLGILGRDQFGIIALMMAIMAILAALDVGITPVIARELNNQRSTSEHKIILYLTAEKILFCIGVVLVAFAMLLPDKILLSTVNTTSGIRDDTAKSLRLIFSISALQLLVSFHCAILSSIEAQVRSNAISILLNVVRGVGVLGPILLLPTIDMFLQWQLAATAIGTVWARSSAQKLIIPGSFKGGTDVDWRSIRKDLRSTNAAFLLAVAASINMNVDKLVIGKLLGLTEIAAYTLTSTIAQLTFVTIVPILLTLSPRLVRTLTSGDSKGYLQLLHVTEGCILSGALSAMTVLALSGPDLLASWTDGRITLVETAVYMPILCVGFGFLSISAISHSVAIAHGDFSFGRPYVVSVFLVGPACAIAGSYLGAVGVALAWMTSQALIMIGYMGFVDHRHRELRSVLTARSLLIGAMVVAVAFLVVRGTWILGLQSEHTIGKLALVALQVFLSITASMAVRIVAFRGMKLTDELSILLVRTANRILEKTKT